MAAFALDGRTVATPERLFRRCRLDVPCRENRKAPQVSHSRHAAEAMLADEKWRKAPGGGAQMARCHAASRHAACELPMATSIGWPTIAFNACQARRSGWWANDDRAESKNTMCRTCPPTLLSCSNQIGLSGGVDLPMEEKARARGCRVSPILAAPKGDHTCKGRPRAFSAIS